MRVLRNPVAQFLAAGAVVVAVVLFGSELLSRHAAEQEAINDARTTTEILARNVIEPRLLIGVEEASDYTVIQLDLLVREQLLTIEGVQRVKIWKPLGEFGKVIYSDEPELVRKRLRMAPLARAALADGTVGDLSDLKHGENRYEVGDNGLLEVYTRIETPDGKPLLLEIYYAPDELEESTASILDAFRPITIGGVLLLGLLTVPLLVGLNRRLRRSAQARERLLRDAVKASEHERSRIARDLHEGMVHDLTEVSTALRAEATAAGTPAMTAQRLRDLDAQVRRGVGSLRSLVLDIYPPKLDADRLAAALDDLVAPAGEAGLDVSVRVDALTGLPDDVVALLWRAARESVRNALRHARGNRLDVSVRRTGRQVSLRVADDGVGFVPGAFSTRTGFGLRSLEDLASEAGGRLDVDSGPGRGTTVLLDVPVG